MFLLFYCEFLQYPLNIQSRKKPTKMQQLQLQQEKNSSTNSKGQKSEQKTTMSPFRSLRCFLCDWKAPPMVARWHVSTHAWAHVKRADDPQLRRKRSACEPFYRCLHCGATMRSIFTHLIKNHFVKKGSKNVDYVDLRAALADEYRNVWVQCFPGVDELLLGQYSIDEIVK